MKSCSRCSVVSDDFTPSRNVCRPCRASDELKRRAARSEEQKLHDRQVIKAWEAANPDTLRESTRKWRKTPSGQEYVRKHVQTRRSKKLEADSGCWFARETVARLVVKDPCGFCGGPGGTLEHVRPLSLSLDDSADNFAGSCLSCNSSKGTQSLLEFLLSRKGDTNE